MNSEVADKGLAAVHPWIPPSEKARLRHAHADNGVGELSMRRWKLLAGCLPAGDLTKGCRDIRFLLAAKISWFSRAEKA
jgi:hypothetical protein